MLSDVDRKCFFMLFESSQVFSLGYPIRLLYFFSFSSRTLIVNELSEAE